MANHFSAFRLSFLSFFPPVPFPPFPFSSSILPSGVQSKRSIKRTSHNRLTIVAQSRPPILFDEISQVTKRVSIECYNSYKNVSRVILTNQTSVIRVILGWLINLMTSQIFNKNINKFPWFEHFYWFEVKFTVHETFFQFFDFIPRLIKHYSKYLSIIKISLSSDETIFFFFFTNKNPSRICSRENSQISNPHNQTPSIFQRIAAIFFLLQSVQPREGSVYRVIPSNYREFLPRIKPGKEGFSRVGINSSGCETLNFRFITFSSQTR